MSVTFSNSVHVLGLRSCIFVVVTQPYFRHAINNAIRSKPKNKTERRSSHDFSVMNYLKPTVVQTKIDTEKAYILIHKFSY